ncbi:MULTISPECIES: AI-2E family transporter [Acidobacterium]|nr:MULTISPECIES: AI-2E family transporter [Acidobacterium]
MVTPWKNIALFLLTLTVLVLCVLVLRVFLAAIVGALVLAVATQPLLRWLRKRLANATAAASIALFIVAIGIILPGALLARILGQYAVAIGAALSNGAVEAAIRQALNHHPQLAALLQHGSRFLTWNNAAERAGTFLSAHAINLLSNSIAALTQIVVMLFLLFFLYRDSRAAVRALYSVLPMQQKEALMLVTSMEGTIRATFLGHLAVAAIQGIVAGIVFAILRVTGAAPLGMLTAVAAMVPSFGAYVVWLPVAVYLGLAGRLIPAILLIVIGALIISTLDNLLYPLLVGAQLRQHPAIILLALLGGIWMFGIAGLVLGPVLFSVAMALLRIWHERSQAGVEAIPVQPQQ